MIRWNNMISSEKVTIHWGHSGYRVEGLVAGARLVAHMASPFKTLVHRIGYTAASDLDPEVVMTRVKVSEEDTPETLMRRVQEDVLQVLCRLGGSGYHKEVKPWLGRRLLWKLPVKHLPTPRLDLV